MKTKSITLREANKLRLERGVPEADILTADAIAAIKDTATLKDEAKRQSGRVLNDLLRNSARGDTRAAIEVLDRGHGKVSQAVEITGEFTIKALHAHVLALPATQEPPEENGPELRA